MDVILTLWVSGLYKKIKEHSEGEYDSLDNTLPGTVEGIQYEHPVNTRQALPINTASKHSIPPRSSRLGPGW